MRTKLWPVVAVTFFIPLGNAQDDAAPASTVPVATVPVATGYAAQGNVAMNKAQHEAEIQRAALAARQRKALKEAMAAYAPKPPVATTAEQFLAVNRPPAQPPREEGAAMSPVKTSIYVPEFDTSARRVNSSAPPTGTSTTVPTASVPERKPGLFDFFKSKKIAPAEVDSGANPDTLDAPAPPAASYEQPGVAAAPVTVGAAPMLDQSEAIAAATVSPAPSEAKPDFFGRLFGKGKKSNSSEAAVPAPDYVGTAPATSAEPSATETPATEAAGIPTPPAFTEGTPTPATAGVGAEN